jgi:hypothetical protein
MHANDLSVNGNLVSIGMKSIVNIHFPLFYVCMLI